MTRLGQVMQYLRHGWRDDEPANDHASGTIGYGDEHVRMDSTVAESFVDEPDDKRAVTDSGGHALDRTTAHITCREDAGLSRLQKQEWGVAPFLAHAVGGCRPGENEAIVVQRQRIA